MNKIFNTYSRVINGCNLFERTAENAQFIGQPAADMIKSKIEENKPLMISRFGSNELNIVLNSYFVNRSFFGNVTNLLKGIPYFLRIKEGVIDNFKMVAGFFPPTVKNIDRFSQLMFRDMPEIDILGSWLNQERFVYRFMKPDHIRVTLGDLTPIRHVHPWSAALKGRKILVVHPFEDSIKRQYLRREKLFKNQDTLPEFELKTLKSVLSLAGNKTEFKDWFEALDFMKGEIERIDFDIAILGCGAYGMPLAAHIKRMNKQAVHLGGETQILFGIKGKRWEDSTYDYHNKFYNEHWVRPALNEVPENSISVEGATYW